MKKKFLLLFCVSSVFLFNGCCAIFDSMNKMEETKKVFSVKWNSSVGTEIKNLSYDTGNFHEYDLYLPIDKSSSKSRHLILFVHGGAWMSGSKEDGTDYCKFFASKGYVAATINYSMTTGYMMPNLNLIDKDHSVSIPKIHEELKKAVVKIKEETSARGYDLIDMATFGFSAGACQTLLYSFKEKAGPLPVKFALDMSGPVTFDPSYWTVSSGVFWAEENVLGLDGSDKSKANFISLFTGQDVTVEMIKNGEAEELWKNISPITYVDSSVVPVLIAFGDYDKLVIPKHSKTLISKLKENGCVFQFFELENSGHSLSCDAYKLSQFRDAAIEYCEKYFE